MLGQIGKTVIRSSCEVCCVLVRDALHHQGLKLVLRTCGEHAADSANRQQRCCFCWGVVLRCCLCGLCLWSHPWGVVSTATWIVQSTEPCMHAHAEIGMLARTCLRNIILAGCSAQQRPRGSWVVLAGR